MPDGLGSQIVGTGPIAPDAVMTVESAKIHRELAVGNFFVTLRGVAGVAGKLLGHVLAQEQEQR